jgi:ankyrin repeat protein
MTPISLIGLLMGDIGAVVGCGSKEMVELLLGNKAAIDARDNEGLTPLHQAAWGGFKEITVLLLANKANVNAKDNNGNTPLYVATFCDNKDIAELLRQHGGHE